MPMNRLHTNGSCGHTQPPSENGAMQSVATAEAQNCCVITEVDAGQLSREQVVERAEHRGDQRQDHRRVEGLGARPHDDQHAGKADADRSPAPPARPSRRAWGWRGAQRISSIVNEMAEVTVSGR